MNPRDFVNRLNMLSRGYQQSQILFTALRGGVFRHLETPHTAAEIAAAVGWDARGARMLLDGLVALELAVSEQGRYRNAPIASQCLVPGAPADQTHILEHAAHAYETWGRFLDAVRTGEAVSRERPDRPPEELRAFILGMADLTRHAAPAVLDAVDLSDRRHLLDLGTGPGAYSIAFLRAHPGLRATLFDFPQVIEIAREQVAAAGLIDRVAFVSGDLTRDEFGNDYDVVLLSNIIHSFGPKTNQAIVKKCHACLRPGGLLIVKDFLVDSGRTGPPFSLIFALHMLVHTGKGDTYTCEDVADWTDAAGFRPGRFVDLGYASRLWLAEK
ncbi:MAG TPA: methyltransferase [Candidatus Hydrogenedentes bacterium]|nr:methyltransferase [Candidatus Hydrogenedentota bacterium]